MWLLAAFVAVPLIEIALFIQVGGAIGLWPTLGVVVVTAILGTTLVRSQGTKALADLRRSMSDLRDPSEPLAHGAMILFAGAMLLTPGFFTDAVGFLLLIPGVRLVAMRELRKRIKVQRFEMGTGAPQGPFDAPGPRPPRQPKDRVIETSYEDVTGRPKPTHDSGWTRH